MNQLMTRSHHYQQELSVHSSSADDTHTSRPRRWHILLWAQITAQLIALLNEIEILQTSCAMKKKRLTGRSIEEEKCWRYENKKKNNRNGGQNSNFKTRIDFCRRLNNNECFLPWCSVKILLAEAKIRESFGARGLLRLARIDEAAPSVERLGRGSLVDCWLPITPKDYGTISLFFNLIKIFAALHFSFSTCHLLIILIRLDFWVHTNYDFSFMLNEEIFLSFFFRDFFFVYSLLHFLGTLSSDFSGNFSLFHGNESLRERWNSLIIRSQIQRDDYRGFLTRNLFLFHRDSKKTKSVSSEISSDTGRKS